MVQVVKPNPQDGAPGVVTESGVGATYHLVSQGELAVYDITVTRALTLTMDGGAKGYRHEIEVWLRQGATGYAVTLPSGPKAASGVAPTVDTTANTLTVLRYVTVDGGKTWSVELVAGHSLS